ncbi:MAG: dUTP diphosphatase, partial [Acidobacteria bacterium]|nr:dUTP diphosphatase [Acidobacteriota bacterium]
VILINHGQEAFTVRRGDRVAQMVVCAVANATLTVCTELDETTRGSGGFGSTGR